MNKSPSGKLGAVQLRLISPTLRSSDGIGTRLIGVSYPKMRAEHYAPGEVRLTLRDMDVAQIKNGMEEFMRVTNGDNPIELIKLTPKETILGLKIAHPSMVNELVRKLTDEIEEAIPF